MEENIPSKKEKKEKKAPEAPVLDEEEDEKQSRKRWGFGNELSGESLLPILSREVWTPIYSRLVDASYWSVYLEINQPSTFGLSLPKRLQF